MRMAASVQREMQDGKGFLRVREIRDPKAPIETPALSGCAVATIRGRLSLTGLLRPPLRAPCFHAEGAAGHCSVLETRKDA